MMEKRRQEWMRGDSTPSTATGSLAQEAVTHCLATYQATAALFEASAMNSTPLHFPAISAIPGPVSARSLSLDHLLSLSPNFKPVPRISTFKRAKLNPSDLEKYDAAGVPIIVEDLHKHPRWPREFDADWFKSHGPSKISVRNVIDGTDKTVPTSEFIDTCRAASPFRTEDERERLYGKDVDCPKEWRQSLGQIIPEPLQPESTYDLLANQPFKGRVETLMCYVGISDTYTPCHKDLCASSGQNLMCYTENDGSSLWFMTAGGDVFKATSYFHQIEKELDHENHFISVDQLSRAPFTVYIAEQTLGDLVLVPSRSCHQVLNRGGITIKTSWSRMTLHGLITAYYHELPIYQRVCRPETYRIKHTIYHTLKNTIDKLKNGSQGERRRRAKTKSIAKPVARLWNSLQSLLEAYNDILSDEAYHPIVASKPSFNLTSLGLFSSARDDTEDRITCDFCGADIFQSFFECGSCVENPGQVTVGYGCVVCPRCYIEGRTCRCGSMTPVQCRSFEELLQVRTEAFELLTGHDAKQASIKEEFDKPGVFTAACLRNQINNINVTRRCSTQGGVHEVKKFDSLYCGDCHRTYCFQHLLAKYDIHAVDAMLYYGSPDKQLYHKFHGSNISTSKTELVLQKFAESITCGSRPDLRYQRYHIVSFHKKCLPASHFVRCGYYDDGWDNKEQYACSYDKAFHDSVPSSPLTSISEYEGLIEPITLEPLPNVQETAAEAPSPNSRKRKYWIVDYVDVPSLQSISKYKRFCNARRDRSEAESRPPPDVQLSNSSLPCPVSRDDGSAVPSMSNSIINATTEQASVDEPAPRNAKGDSSVEVTNVSVSMNVDEEQQPQGNGEDILANLNEYRTSEAEKWLANGSHNETGRDLAKDIARKHGPNLRSKKAAGTQNLAEMKSVTRNNADSHNEVNSEVAEDPKPSSTLNRDVLDKDSVEPHLTDDSDTAVASRASQLPELLQTSQINSASSHPAGSMENVLSGGRRTNSRQRSSSPSVESVVEQLRPPRRPRRDREASAQRRTNYRRDQLMISTHSEPNCAPAVAEALTSALNHNASPPNRKQKKAFVTAQRDDHLPAPMPERPSQEDQPSPDDYKKRIHELESMVAGLQDKIRQSEDQPHNTPALDKKTIHDQHQRDDTFRAQAYPSEDQPQPSLSQALIQEQERKLHDLESRLAAVETGRQSKQIFDELHTTNALLQRAISNTQSFPAVSPQVYLTPIAVGNSESGLNSFRMPNESYNYRGNHAGNPRCRPREPVFHPGRFPFHPTEPIRRYPHNNAPRPGYGMRQPHGYSNNNHNYNYRSYFRPGWQRRQQTHGESYNRGRDFDNSPRYGTKDNSAYHERDQPVGTIELRHRIRQPSQSVGPSDAYRHAEFPEIGSSDLQRYERVDTPPFEAIAGTSSNAETHTPLSRHSSAPPSPERDELHDHVEESHQDARHSLRTENNETHMEWEDEYAQEDRDGDGNVSGNHQTSNVAGAVFGDIDNPWTS
ncbi:hypothetical protein APHAL10511_001034 [Amanita phalloides]|nr:hypothetical protein APHAL10511_001034 [Amanita phalloides]